MALFGFSKKKKEEMPKPAPGGLPTDQVIMMKQQGYTDEQIAQNLQSQGYNSSQIFDAVNQINISGPMQYQSTPYQAQQPFRMDEQMPPPPSYGSDLPAEQQQADRVEELAEAIIEEKWKEIVTSINKVIEWKDRAERRITKIEQQLLDFKISIDSLQKSVLTKINQYDQNIQDVGTEIKAMEKVFQNVLPSLTENVNKLERLTKKAPPK